MHINASNAIMTKSRTKYGHRLTDDNYREMLSITTISDAAAYLKNKSRYSDVLQNIKESAIHRGNLEAILHSQMFEDFAALCRFESSVGEHFYEYLLLRGETEQILNFLRFFQSGHPQDYLFALPDFFNRHTSIDLVALSKIKTYDQILKILEHTDFYDVLKNFRPENDEMFDYTLIEAALDSFLFNHLLKLINKNFKGSTNKELKELFGQKAELDNIKMIYRAKKYYNATPDSIRAKLIPHTYLLNSVQQNALIATNNAEDVLKTLLQTKYKRFFKENESWSVDHLANVIIYRRARKYIRFSNNPAVVFASYIILLEFEIYDITNIIEGIRYHLPPDEIEKLLVKYSAI